jgi:phosphoglucose isomerase-like protein
MLDESLLETPAALTRADTAGLLRGVAEAGARVRTALRQADDAGVFALRPDGRPRAVLVAGAGPVTGCVADLLGAFAGGAVPVTLLRPTGPLAAPGALRWTLPGWAGAMDLLLIASATGDEAGLDSLVDQAYRRGCTVVAVVPERAQITELVGQVRGLVVPLAAAPFPAQPAATAVTEPEQQVPLLSPGSLWALLTPLLALTDRLGLLPAPRTDLEAMADRLDQVAEHCGPAVAVYDNPGKLLATELAGTLPLLWSEDAVAGAAARHCATTLTVLPGRPALAAELPEALTAHGALLAGPFASGADSEDFFRDRVEDPAPLHARVVLLREHAPDGTSAAVAARDLAYAHDTPLSELEAAEGSGPLTAAAQLIATTDFAAVYLTLADGNAR